MSEFPKNTKFTYVKSEPKDDILSCGIPIPYDCDKELPSKKVVIVGAPGAFTPTCTADHVPPYISKAKEFKAKGVDQIIVITANDPFVLSAWSKALKNDSDGFIIFASDGNSEFAKKIGYDLDLTSKGMGVRNARFAMVVDHNKIVTSEKESDTGVSVSSAENILSKL